MDYIQNLNKDIEKVIGKADTDIQKLVKAAVVQSFKNGIEVGKGKKLANTVTAEKETGDKPKA